jgi:ribonuclease P protein component
MEQQLPDKDDGAGPAAGSFGRLRKRAEFQRVARGRRKALEAFTLQAAPREAAGDGPVGPRVGFTVTRKVGNAVVRNRIRRRLREALRAARPLEVEADHDYVLMARQDALARSFAALVEDLRQAFRAVGRKDRDHRDSDNHRPAAQTTPKGGEKRA